MFIEISDSLQKLTEALKKILQKHKFEKGTILLGSRQDTR